MFLLREGITPLIIEAADFPRYHIGESMTGGSAKVLRDLGLENEMNRRGFPVKKGVKVYGTSGKTTWFVPVTARDENWQLQDSSAWQVRRSEFDTMMLDEAVKRGAKLLKAKATKPLLKSDGSVRGVEVRHRDGQTEDIESELLLDISGQATFLANHGVTGPKYLGSYDKQIAIFTQVEGTVRDDGSTTEKDPSNTISFYNRKFHWVWFIPLDDNIVSVGRVGPADYFLGTGLSTKDYLSRELTELNPAIRRYIPEVKTAGPVHVIPNYSYQVRRFTGRGFVCVGDAHRFIDPIFSFGLTVTMRESQVLAPLVKAYLEGKNPEGKRPFEDYEKFCEFGIDTVEDAIDLFWEYPYAFAKAVYYDFPDLMTDVLAGRFWEHQPSPGIIAFRKALKRERRYDRDDYSIPVGSRFHPERAAIWEPNSPVKSTEEWLGPR